MTAAAKFLVEHSDFSPETIEGIADAIGYHSDPPVAAEEYLKELDEKGEAVASFVYYAFIVQGIFTWGTIPDFFTISVNHMILFT